MRLMVIALPMFAGSVPVGSTVAQEGDFRAELVLQAPIEPFRTLEEFVESLDRHLVWNTRGGDGGVTIGLQSIRIDRGRIVASRRSPNGPAPLRPTSVSRSLGGEAWNATFPDCCLVTADPPMAVRALSGKAYLDPGELERAVAYVAEKAVLDGAFGLERPVDLEWGRQSVLILAATSDSPLLVRPLVLILQRE